jgi:hypothetical protein
MTPIRVRTYNSDEAVLSPRQMQVIRDKLK